MRKRKKHKQKRIILAIVCVLLLSFASCTLYMVLRPDGIKISDLKKVEMPEYVDVQLLEIGTSRQGRELKAVNDIVIHYVGNPGTTAQQNHNYFGNEGTTVNSHFVIGLEGEIIRCVPIYERSVASNHRNKDTISIEVCHPDESGKFNRATRDSLIKLTAWLCKTCKLSSNDVIRHYDVTGKLCPIYYVENEDAWEKLIKDIDTYIKTES